MTSSQIGRAVVLSAALCVVLATRVFVAFESVRVKIVDAPVTATAASAQVSTKGHPRANDLTPPFALIARIRNHGAATEPFFIQVDGHAVCNASVAGARSRRVDCAFVDGRNRLADHEIAVRGPTTPWTLEYLELATHHGATRAYDLLILPASSSHYTRPSAGRIALAWSVLALMLLLPQPSLPRWPRVLYRALSVLVVTLFVLTVVSRLVSPYVVLLSHSAFIRLVCVLLASRLWWAGRWLVHGEQRAAWWARPLACGLVATLVLAVYGTLVTGRLRDSHQGNYSGFLQLSRVTFDRNPMLNGRDDVRRTLVLPEEGGYDAQFMYFATFDPFLRLYKDHPSTYRQFIDAPPYRFGRIGFTLLTKLFSGDRWQLYPITMVWLILGSLFLCSVALAVGAHAVGATPWWGALILVVPGFWQSLQAALPEPVAASLLVTGYLCLVHSKWSWAGLLFALSLLVRETGVILVLCVTAAMMISGKRREAVRVAVIALAPLAVWRLYIGTILFPDWGVYAFLFNPAGAGVPFAGILELWILIARGQYYPELPELSRAGIWYPLVLASGFSLAVALAIRLRSALGIAAVLYAGLAISLSYASVWVHVGNAQRVTYEMFVALALLSAGAGSYPQLLRVSLLMFWAGAAAYVFFGAYDAQYIRDAVLGPLGIPW